MVRRILSDLLEKHVEDITMATTFAPGPISQADPIYPYSVQPADLRPDGAWRLVYMLTQEIVGTFPTYAAAQAVAKRLTAYEGN
jgi:hypothetical protein